MLLTKLYIIDINITKRYKDPLVLFNDKFNRLFIVVKDRL
jgi:hypothetical protein